MLAVGEGWHNFHHVFPWDYKAAELGNYRLNFTTAFLDLMAKIGWAYDLKTASPEMIESRVKRTGDGSRIDENNNDHHIDEGEMLWGWGDVDMGQKEKELVKNFNNIKED